MEIAREIVGMYFSSTISFKNSVEDWIIKYQQGEKCPGSKKWAESSWCGNSLPTEPNLNISQQTIPRPWTFLALSVIIQLSQFNSLIQFSEFDMVEEDFPVISHVASMI